MLPLLYAVELCVIHIFNRFFFSFLLFCYFPSHSIFIEINSYNIHSTLYRIRFMRYQMIAYKWKKFNHKSVLYCNNFAKIMENSEEKSIKNDLKKSGNVLCHWIDFTNLSETVQYLCIHICYVCVCCRSVFFFFQQYYRLLVCCCCCRFFFSFIYVSVDFSSNFRAIENWIAKQRQLSSTSTIFSIREISMSRSDLFHFYFWIHWMHSSNHCIIVDHAALLT